MIVDLPEVIGKMTHEMDQQVAVGEADAGDGVRKLDVQLALRHRGERGTDHRCAASTPGGLEIPGATSQRSRSSV